MTTVNLPMDLDLVIKASMISTHSLSNGGVRLELLFCDGDNYHSLWKGVVTRAQVKEIMSIQMFTAHLEELMEGL